MLQLLRRYDWYISAARSTKLITRYINPEIWNSDLLHGYEQDTENWIKFHFRRNFFHTNFQVSLTYGSIVYFIFIFNLIHYSLPSTYRVLSQRPHDKDICRGGEYHRLHEQFRPPDDGPVRPEKFRGKRIADIVCRRKRIVYHF